MNNTVKCLLILTVALVAVGPALAQSPTDAQNKLLAKRAAEADCYRKLAETVNGVQINSETFVRDFVTESDEIRAKIDTFVKGIRLGKPRWYDDGICEVDAEVTVAKLIKTLKEVHHAHYRGRRVTETDIQEIKTRIQKDVIRVTGSGAPRPELPPDLPPGIEEFIEPLPQNYAPPRMTIPAIWRTVSPQARLMAVQAARRDAQRQLLERIKGLRLNSETLVRDFVTEYDEISTNAHGLVVGAAEVRQYLHNDELIAEVTMEVPVEKVITTLKEMHSQHYKGRKVVTTDIQEIRKYVKRNSFEATGMGVPPARFTQQAQPAGPTTSPNPDWITFPIKVVGEGTDADMSSGQGKLKAARAARLDAMRKLAEHIRGLELTSNTLVRDFVTEYDEISTQVNATVAGALFSEPVFEDGVARVTATLAGAELWHVLHQHMMIVNRRG